MAWHCANFACCWVASRVAVVADPKLSFLERVTRLGAAELNAGSLACAAEAVTLSTCDPASDTPRGSAAGTKLGLFADLLIAALAGLHRSALACELRLILRASELRELVILIRPLLIKAAARGARGGSLTNPNWALPIGPAGTPAARRRGQAYHLTVPPVTFGQVLRAASSTVPEAASRAQFVTRRSVNSTTCRSEGGSSDHCCRPSYHIYPPSVRRAGGGPQASNDTQA